MFIDTGWDSVQEVEQNAFQVEKVVEFSVQDELTEETYVGFSLEEKGARMNAKNESESAIIIRNLY